MAFQNVDFMKEKKKNQSSVFTVARPKEVVKRHAVGQTQCVRHDKDVNAKEWKSLSGL